MSENVGRPFEFSAVWTVNAPRWERSLDEPDEGYDPLEYGDAELQMLAADWQRLSDRAAFLRREDGES